MKKLILLIFFLLLSSYAYSSTLIARGSGADVTPPAFSSATINGTALVINWSEACTRGAGYNDSDLDLDMSTTGSNIGVTYQSGDGTSQWTLTAASAAVSGETVDLDFNGDANSIEDDSGNDLAALTSETVTNNTSAASYMCNGSCLADDADLICEDGQGDCAWTETGTGISSTSTTGLSTLQSTCSGYTIDYVYELAMTASSDHYISKTFTGTTNYYDEFYIRISSTALNTNGQYQIIAYKTAGAGIDTGLYLYYLTDHLIFQVSIDGSRQNTSHTVSLNTWYKVTWHYQGATTVTLDINESNVFTDSTVTENDSMIGTVFGTPSALSNYAVTMQIALFKADNDTEPAVCE